MLGCAHVLVTGRRCSIVLAGGLIEHPTPFCVEPLPNDIFRFTVKNEIVSYIKRLENVYNLFGERLK